MGSEDGTVPFRAQEVRVETILMCMPGPPTVGADAMKLCPGIHVSPPLVLER